MSHSSLAHFIFVDFENVPDVDLGLIHGRAAHVTLLIGKNQTRLDLALVHQIQRLASFVKLVEVGATGHNALDLTLAYYLGQTVQPGSSAHFHIVSNDRDFDPMIAHLVARGIKVTRCAAFHLLSFLPRSKAIVSPTKPAQPKAPVVALAKPLEDKSAKLIARLKNPGNANRPATEKALRAHIKTGLGKNSTPAGIEEVLRRLRDSHTLTFATDGKVAYAVAK